MTDPKDLPPQVQRHMKRARELMSRPIPPEGKRPPTREEMEAAPDYKRRRALFALSRADISDEERAKRTAAVEAMSDAEILATYKGD